MVPDHPPILHTDILLNGFCVQPSELTVKKFILGDGSESQQRPGVALSLLLIRTGQDGSIRYIDTTIAIDRGGATALRDALTAYLDDGLHHHYWTGEELQRMSNTTTSVQDIEPVDLPDTLDGLL